MEANIDKKDEVVFVLRTTGVVVNTEGSPLFSESATKIEIVDEAAGEFLEISQTDDDVSKIRITKEEWPSIQAAIDLMIRNLK